MADEKIIPFSYYDGLQGAEAYKHATLKQYKSRARQINIAMKWQPYDAVHFDKYNKYYKQIIEWAPTHRDSLNSQEKIKTYLKGICSLMTAVNDGDKNHLFGKKVNALCDDKKPEGEIEKFKRDDHYWPNVVEELTEMSVQDSGNVTINKCTVALIFSYGYVLRVAEMFNTGINDNDQSDNYLDFDKCEWVINIHKNSSRQGSRTFSVNPDLCAELKSRLAGKRWLLPTPTGISYCEGKQYLRTIGWDYFSNTELRKCFETWNRHDSGHSDDEIKTWNYILGHKPETVDKYYDMHDSADESMESSVNISTGDDVDETDIVPSPPPPPVIVKVARKVIQRRVITPVAPVMPVPPAPTNHPSPIGIVSGYFDPIHKGHIEYLRLAKEYLGPNGKLFVIVNNSGQAQLKKGKVVIPDDDRLAVIRSIKYVDRAFLSVDSDRTVSKTVQIVAECFPITHFLNGGDVVSNCAEEGLCKSLGIECVYGFGEKITSSSSIMNAYNVNV
jgi:cytidyltransferase-like protein